MSSDPPDPNELLKFLLAQQQQHTPAPFAQQPQYQQQPPQQQMAMPPPAPAQPQAPPNNPSLNQLLEYLQAQANQGPPPAPPAPTPQENYERLQRYLQGNQTPQQQPVHQQHQAPIPQQNGFGFQQDAPLIQPQVYHQTVPHVQVPQVHQLPQQQGLIVQQQAQQVLNQQSNQSQNLTLQQRQDILLASVKLLAELNPGMAAVAVLEALNMPSPSPAPQAQQQQQQAPPQPQFTQQGSFQQQKAQPNSSHHHGASQASLASARSPFVLNQLQQPPPASSKSNSARRDTASVPLTNDNLVLPQNGKGIISLAAAMPPPSPHHPMPPLPRLPPPTVAAAAPKVPALPPMNRKGLMPPPLPNKGSLLSPNLASLAANGSPSTNGATKKASKKEASRSKAKASKKPAKKEETEGVPQALQHPPALPPIPTPDKATLQSWSLDQLEMHVQQLKHARQPIPQHVAVLLFNTRRKEEKRKAKRLANRKSATISRARKKAFIEDMMKDNARLRKRETILKFLPDLVIAINMEGDITFCGGQVEKMLRHKTNDLLGANIEQIVVPDSRRTMQRLIKDLTSTTEQQDNSGEAASEYRTERNGSANRPDRLENEGNNSNGSSDANVISLRSSEKSIPMLEVNVDAVQTSAEEDVSDSSADRRSKKEKDGSGGKHKSKGNDTTTEISSLTHQKSSLGSETSTGNENGEPAAKKVKISAAQEKTNCGESEESISSRKASDHITNNVDDVMGASVTANNADAKLSSLMHYPKMQSKESRVHLDKAQQPGLHRHQKHVTKQPDLSPKTSEHQSLSSIAESCQSRTKKTGANSGSEDSGYRESNESPEESNESPEESSSSSVSSEAARGKNSG